MLRVLDIVPTLILLAGVVDDLRSRKVHNKLVLGLFGVAVLSSFYFGGWQGLIHGALGAGAAFLLCLVLVSTRIIGAGDMKLMVAFGMATSAPIAISVVLWSTVWAAILGLIRATVAGQLPQLLMSTYNVARRRQTTTVELQKIPYTIALFFGWLTYLALSKLPSGVFL